MVVAAYLLLLLHAAYVNSCRDIVVGIFVRSYNS